MRPKSPPKKPDGIDTPGLAWRPRAAHWAGYWIARGDITSDGYPIKSRLVWPPSTAPLSIPTDENWLSISSVCNQLQDEMLTWRKGPTVATDTAWYNGHIKSLIRIYLSDPDSPYHALRHDSKTHYRTMFDLVEQSVGEAVIPTLTFRDFKSWFDTWKKPAEPGMPDRIASARARLTAVKVLLTFGKLLKLRGCAEARDILSDMKFKGSKRRRDIVTRAQAAALCGIANRDGYHSIAFGQALQSDLMVRQKDVIGDWIPIEDPGTSGIIWRGMKWVVGFRWENVDENFRLEHRLSKSLRGRDALAMQGEGNVKVWKLLLYPLVVMELCRMAQVHRPSDLRRDQFPASGPLVVSEKSGRPWLANSFAVKWRSLARLAEIPDTVQNRDSRAGGATEAEQSGIDLETIRKGLGHAKAETTRIYTRDEEAAEARIVLGRFGKPPEQR